MGHSLRKRLIIFPKFDSPGSNAMRVSQRISEGEGEGRVIGSWPRQQALLTYLVAFDLHIIKAAKIAKYAKQLELWPRLTASKE